MSTPAEPFWAFFSALLAAHVLADFVIQRRKDVERKTELWVFGRHIGIVCILTWILLGSLDAWLAVLVTGAGHAAIDACKLWAERRRPNSRLMFFILDQLAHLAVIAGLLVFYAYRGWTGSIWVDWMGPDFTRLLIFGSGFILCVRTGGIVIGMATVPYLEEIRRMRRSDPQNASPEGLSKGGSMIGQLERLLIFFFFMAGHLEGVAFLVAAKSVFRFGELTKHSRKEAEYILIGTLMSFAWALVTSWLVFSMLEILERS